jgi:maltose alpha-D-glucosyltransferase/alpha-amylase
VKSEQAKAVLVRLDDGRSMVDGFYDDRFRTELLHLLARGGTAQGKSYRLSGHPEASLASGMEESMASRPWRSHGPSFAANFGDQWFLKCLRHFEPGQQPDAEVLQYLGKNGRFENAPEFFGTLSLTGSHGSGTFATLSRFLPNGGTGWVYTLDAIERFFERVLSKNASVDVPAEVEEAISGNYRERSIRGGETVAALHRALAEETDDADFQPEPFSTLYQRSLYQSMRGNLGRMLRRLRAAQTILLPVTLEAGEKVITVREQILARYARLLEGKIAAEKIRVHGNLSLHSLINTGKNWSFVDFAGGAEGSIGERSLKRCALADVACLLRSTEEAMELSLARQRGEDMAKLRPWANRWLELVGQAFLSGYRLGTRDATFVPTSQSDFDLLLDVFLLDEAVKDIAKAAEVSADAVTTASRSLFRLIESPYSANAPEPPAAGVAADAES